MLDSAPLELESEADAPASESPPPWLKGGEITLFGLALLIFLASVVWLICSVATRGSLAGQWGPQALICLAAIIAVSGSMTRTYRLWLSPTRQLCKLLPLIQNAEMPINSLSEIGGGLEALAPVLRELLRECRRQRGEVKKLEGEIRQRVANRTDALERAMGSLRQKATRDPLTGLYNRRMLDECLPRLIERRNSAKTAAGGRRQPAGPNGLCLLMIDVDDFKMLNDTLGHAAGDELLRSIGQLIRSAVRESDMAFRCGGDEFVVLLDGCGEDDGQVLAARLISLVDGLTRTLHVPRPPRLSIGVSQPSDLKELTPQALLQEADRLLYEVKGARKAALGRAAVGRA